MEDELLTRRRALGWLGALGVVGAAALAGCSDSNGDDAASASSGSSASTTTTDAGGCTTEPIAEETEGPYQLDLGDHQKMYRSDITEGRPGVPLALTMALVNVDDGCTPIADARVDVWHCDKDGVYSGFDQPNTDTVGETFMRGIQMSDAQGNVTFQTVYPGWYQGRITHIHFQVFVDDQLVTTSQLAFPEEITTAVYDSELYADKGQNTSVSGFDDDGVFRDGTDSQMLELTGDTASGYNAQITVSVSA